MMPRTRGCDQREPRGFKLAAGGSLLLVDLPDLPVDLWRGQALLNSADALHLEHG